MPTVTLPPFMRLDINDCQLCYALYSNNTKKNDNQFKNIHIIVRLMEDLASKTYINQDQKTK